MNRRRRNAARKRRYFYKYSYLYETPRGRVRWMWIEEWRTGRKGVVPSIYGLRVNPEDRRKGVATVLLMRAIGQIRRDGYEGEILIQALPDENSISRSDLEGFYKSLGLTVVKDWEDPEQ